MKRILSISAFCFLFSALCFGQFNFADLAFQPKPAAAASSFSPTNISGMAYWWSYESLGAGNVTDWDDIITAKRFSWDSAGNQPVKSSSGVYFDNTRMNLSAQVTLGTTNISVWMVITFNTFVSGYNAIITTANGGSQFATDDNSNRKFVYYNSSAKILAGNLTTNVAYNLVWANGQGWTNAVQGLSVTPHTAAFSFIALGKDTGGEKINGYLRHVGIWTNVILSGADVTNLNTYSQTH